MNIKQEIREIFRQAEYVFGAKDSCGNPGLVPFCERIVNIARKYPEREDEIELVFLEDFEKYYECSWELAQITMFHLKLPCFKAFLEKKLEYAHSK